MNFSHALDEIKQGRRMKRHGWNGKDQFVYLVKSLAFTVNRPPLDGVYKHGEQITYRAHIDMKYQDGTCGVWLASMGDLLADDWDFA